MPREATIYRVLIASPSDVFEEREAVQNVIYNWNASNSVDMSIMFEPVLWETHVIPELGDRPQSIINKQIVNDSDILIGIFWTRIGTSTGTYESGTIEEIEQFIKSKKLSMVYFSKRQASIDQIESNQLNRLRKFQKKCEQLGVISTYGGISEFKLKLNQHISKIAFTLTQKQSNEEDFSKKIETAASNYDYQEDKERLRIQADSLQELDLKNIRTAISYIRKFNPEKVIKVLDIGCSDGYVTYSRFSKFDDIQIVGVDISKTAIEVANRNYADENFSFRVANIEDENIHSDEYDLIFCSFVLHHLKNPEGIMHKLWSSLNSHGSIIMSSVDDGTIINYPPNHDLEFLIQSTNLIKGGPDRLHGREFYSHIMSLDTEPVNVEMDFQVSTTVNMDKKERLNYFLDCHSFRSGYAERLANEPDSTPSDIKLAKKLKRIIEEQKNRFVNEKGLFALEVIPILIAHKP